MNLASHRRAPMATSALDSTTSSNQNVESSDSHIITWETTDGTVTFPARHGELLRTAALRHGQISPHNGRANLINCRGLGTCGTCAVMVEGASCQRNSIETARLSLPPHSLREQEDSLEDGTALRLACQLQVCNDLRVRKGTGFWGQRVEELAGFSQATKPFGDLEYLLDRQSPSEEDR